MVLNRQKVWTDGQNGRMDDAKTISLRLRRGIINSPMVASVVVITSLGKHVFSEEFIQGNNALG